MADSLSKRCGDLLTGSYDCVDRIVLNAYFSLGHHPGGFRVWWRRLNEDSDEQLDKTHLMRMAGRFARRVRAWAAASNIPLIDCGRRERKHRVAEDYLATHTVEYGVFLILVAKAPASVWEVSRSVRGAITNLAKKTSTSTTTRSTSWIRSGGTSRSRCPGIRPSAPRSSSMATSTWLARHGRPR